MLKHAVGAFFAPGSSGLSITRNASTIILLISTVDRFHLEYCFRYGLPTQIRILKCLKNPKDQLQKEKKY